MGQPRASRRKIVTSDDEDEVSHAVASEASDYEEPKKPKSGQLKRIDKTKKSSRSANGSSTQTASSQLSPPKAKATKVKSKTATKDAPKANTKTIYSFFNSATQRQSSVQPTPSPQKDSTPIEQLEAIQDDSGDDISPASLALSKDSSTAFSMRKRKLQHGPMENDNAAPPAPAHKFRKTNDSAPSFSAMNEYKRPWTERFAPVDLNELAVHKKKVADVRQWMELALGGRRQKVLVLKGAAGAGKTTTAKLLAADLGHEVLEWRNPGGSDGAAEGSVSAAAQFEEFIGRAGRANGLTLSTSEMPGDQLPSTHGSQTPTSEKRRRQILLVEEFPNTFSRTSTVLQSFRSSLLQYVSTSPLAEGTSTPIIMVISETLLSTNTAAADSFTAHRLLGPELVSHPFINTLEFNPVATTFLTKALETIVLKEARKSGRRKTPGPQVLKHIAESGDIRSAISSLEFLCLRGDSDGVWSSKVAFTKPKKARSDVPLTASEIEALKLISNRENTLGIFHAVGKVMYNKRIEPSAASGITQPPPWLPQHRRTKVSEVRVGPLIDELGTDTSTFIASLHENYPPSCSNTSSEEALESLNGCIDSISDADLLSLDRFSFGTRAFSGSATDSIRQDEMAFQVAVRGILFDLPCPVQRSMAVGANKADAHRMFYPTSLKTWRKKEEIGDILELLTSKVQNGTLDEGRSSKAERSTNSLQGVEAWKSGGNAFASRRQSPTQSSDVEDKVIKASKTQMLLERLPYMNLIMASRDTSRDTGRSSNTLEQIRSVTQVQGQPPMDNETVDNDDDQLDPNGQEQWATDKPDGEAQAASKQLPKHTSGKNGKIETEGGGLSIPVESRVEALVLEDDDIVDD